MGKDLQNSIFHCYSFRLCHFLQSQGFRYKEKKINNKNHLTYFSFEKSDSLNNAIEVWRNLKDKSKLEEKNGFRKNGH